MTYTSFGRDEGRQRSKAGRKCVCYDGPKLLVAKSVETDRIASPVDIKEYAVCEGSVIPARLSEKRGTRGKYHLMVGIGKQIPVDGSFTVHCRNYLDGL